MHIYMHLPYMESQLTLVTALNMVLIGASTPCLLNCVIAFCHTTEYLLYLPSNTWPMCFSVYIYHMTPFDQWNAPSFVSSRLLVPYQCSEFRRQWRQSMGGYHDRGKW